MQRVCVETHGESPKSHGENILLRVKSWVLRIPASLTPIPAPKCKPITSSDSELKKWQFCWCWRKRGLLG